MPAKRVLSILMILIVLLVSSSCNDNRYAKDMVDNAYDSIVQYDSKSLYDSFSARLKKNKGLKDDLDSFMSEIEKLDLSFEDAVIEYSAGGESKDYHFGKITRWGGEAIIESIIGADNAQYTIHISYIAINESDESKVGLFSIRLYEEGNKNEEDEYGLLLEIGENSGEYLFVNRLIKTKPLQ
ncbi:MAG: hypothetical protein IKN14_02135 [Clostridiales bacterium]|nr:hypothetical protein [Clostridiales bacterium]